MRTSGGIPIDSFMAMKAFSFNRFPTERTKSEYVVDAFFTVRAGCKFTFGPGEEIYPQYDSDGEDRREKAGGKDYHDRNESPHKPVVIPGFGIAVEKEGSDSGHYNLDPKVDNVRVHFFRSFSLDYYHCKKT